MDIRFVLTAVLAASLALGAGPASADTVHLSNGQTQVGVIVGSKTNASQVTIRTTSGEITLPRSRVTRVEEQPTDVSYTQLGDAYLASGDFEKAIEAYQTALEFNSSNLDVQQKLQQARGGVATLDATAQAQMDEKTRRVVEQSMRLAANNNFDSAINTLRSVEPTETSPMRAEYNKALVNINMLWGQYLLDRQNTGGAAEKFQFVLRLDPENQRARELLVKTFEGDPTKLQESAEFYLQSQNPEDQLKGAEALYKLQQYEQALPVYTKYMSDPELSKKYNITSRLQFILDTLHQQYASRGDYRQALAYFTQYLQVNPEADPMPYSKYMYMIKRSETDMNSLDARLELALLGEQLGLIPTAKEEYRNILAMDPESTGALSALRRFAESDLADAREFLGSGQYTLASEMAEDVIANYTMYPDLTAAANQIQAVARVEAAKVQQSIKAQAVALAERGDNYYSQAMQYTAAYVSTEVDESRRIFSPRNEAAKYLGQAIYAWKTAVEMDPSLGDPTTYNLYYKIQDASAKYSVIANRRPPPLPPRATRTRN